MNKFETERVKKLETIRQLGCDPYGQRLQREPDKISIVRRDIELWLECQHNIEIISCKTYYSNTGDKQGLGRHIAGRVVSKNNKGKLKFFWVQDDTGSIQIMCSKDHFEEHEWNLISCIDVGDIISVGGMGIATQKKGEITLFVGGYEKTFPYLSDSARMKVPDTGVQILCKSLSHPPEKYHGI